MTAPETEERVSPAIAAPPRTPARLRAAVAAGLADPVERAGYALVAVSLLVWTWAASRSYFRHDDFVYFHRAETTRFDLGFLFTGYQGHLMPGQFLLVEAVARWAPLSWAAAVAVVLVFRLVAGVAAVRLLVELFGRRTGVLAPLAVLLFCPLLVLPLLWWAAALQVVTLQAFTLLAALAHVRWLRTGRTRYGVLAVLAVGGGLFFWEKALLIPLVLAGVEVLARRGGMPVAAARRRPVRLAHLLLAAGWVLLYLWRTDPAGRQTTPPTPARVLALVRETLLDGVLPGLVGGPWSDGYVAGLSPEPATWTVVVSLLIVAAVVGWTVRARARVAVPAWLLLAVYLGFDIGLLAAVRLDFIGPDIGRDPRYTADAVLVAALALGFALLPVAGPPTGPTPPSDPAHRFPEPPVPRRPAVAATLVLLPAYLVSCLLSTASAAQHMERTSARSYVDTARAELARQPGAVLWDGPVPDNVIAAIFEEEATVSRVLAGLPGPPRFGEPTGDLRMFDGLALLRPVDVIAQVRGRPSGNPACGYPVQEGRDRPVPLTGVARAGPQVVRIGYYAARAVPGTVTADLTRIRVVFQQGVHYLFVVVQGPVGQLTLTLDPAETGAGICATDVVIGQPWPKQGS